jgi:hypothetical protein
MIQITNAVERYGKLILNELKEANINCWIAGGALRDYFAGVKVNTDYDLFFPNEIEYEKARTYFKAKECFIKWESNNGIKIVYNGKTFDLVKKFFASPKETINAFDFTVSMLAVDSGNLYYGETTFMDLAKRQLMINKITYPASTMSRAFRYYKKGFSMCLGEMKKLVESIQDMPKPEPEKQKEEDQEEDKSSGDNLAFFVGID